MDKELAEQIKENINKESTDELLRIWIENDRKEWTDETFDVIKQVLIQRGEKIPEQKKPLKEDVNLTASKLDKVKEDWVVICSVNGEVEGNIIKSKFDSEGIPVICRQEAIGKLTLFIIDGLGEVKVLIPCHYKEKALEILSLPGKIPAVREPQQTRRRK